MKLGKPHLIASLVMVVASIAYNVWVFTRPARRGAPGGTSVLLAEGLSSSGPVVTGEDTVAAVDPTTVPPPPEVDVVHAPEWGRNPFASAWQRPAEVLIAPVAAIESEPDLVVASILHSADRRLAVVNGRIVRAGDHIGSTTILEIQPRAILVQSSRGAQRVIELKTAPGRRNAK
jgi:hypothetical protein